MSIVKESGAAPAVALLDEESPPSLIDIGYPLGLTPTESTVDLGTNLTASEFWALQNTWTYIKSRWHRYALELYVDFYTENHNHINRFRSKKTGKICVIIFSEHAKMVFALFREIVENGLKNWGKSKNRINAITIEHVAHGISLIDLILMADAFKDLVLQKCEGITTPTVVIALEKLFREIFEQHKAREIVGNDDVSLEIQE